MPNLSSSPPTPALVAGSVNNGRGGGGAPDSTAESIPVIDWHSCYDGQWRDLIVPEAFAHPAKFAPNLIQRIYAHGLQRGWWKRGDVVADPFGGIAGGGIMAGYAGLNWIGVELEGRFCTLGNRNLDLHRPKWAALGIAVTVRLVQGDSRAFARIVGEAAAVITSPPYAESLHLNEAPEVQEARMARKGQSSAIAKSSRGGKFVSDSNAGYGASAGQIGALPSGDIAAVITSPPYAESLKPETEDQSGDVAAIVTSPPYEGTSVAAYDGSMGEMYRETGQTPRQRSGGMLPSEQYNHANSENIGNLKGGWNKLAPHTDYVYTCGICGESIGGDECHNVKIAESKLDGEADGADSVVENTSANPSRGGRNPKNGKRRSRRLISAFPNPNTSEACTETGREEITLGGDSLGEFSAERPSNETGENVAGAAVPSGSSSTTRKINQELAENGITSSKTSKRSAGLATTDTTLKMCGNTRICAKCAALGTSREVPQSDRVHQNARPHSTPQSIKGGCSKNGEPETYWEAVAQVYAQCLIALRPGGYAVVVVKDYVQKKKRVPLCDQTLSLLTHLGFEPVERIRANLVHEERSSGLFGEHVKRKSRKSFFRRLAEKRGSPAIDWEECLVVRKPEDQT
jgi:hypothetical protein